MTEKGPTPADCDLITYDTTMATNALIERKGAKTPTLTTEEWATRSKSPTKVGSNYFRGAIHADDWARAARKHGTH